MYLAFCHKLGILMLIIHNLFLKKYAVFLARSANETYNECDKKNAMQGIMEPRGGVSKFSPGSYEEDTELMLE